MSLFCTVARGARGAKEVKVWQKQYTRWAKLANTKLVSVTTDILIKVNRKSYLLKVI